MRDEYGEATDGELVAAMRRGIPGALQEFIERYHRLVILVGGSNHIPADEREHWAEERLHHIALRLMDQREVPSSLRAYVVMWCVRCALARDRDQRARRHIESEQTLDLAGVSPHGRSESVLSATASEGSIRDAAGPVSDPALLPVALERLVSAMQEGLTEEERRLLSWVAQRISYTTIAAWLKEPRSTVVSRVTRLRARLLEAAYRYTWWLDRADHAEVLKFFRRTGVFSEAELDMLEQRRATSAEVARRVERTRSRRVAEPGPPSGEETER